MFQPFGLGGPEVAMLAFAWLAWPSINGEAGRGPRIVCFGIVAWALSQEVRLGVERWAANKAAGRSCRRRWWRLQAAMVAAP